ncbi:ompA family protein [Caballeronia calidae]|uniref:OmpA family protein n=2 Tax=Caballeronia calidae TaxID=1777139 RepID=A0A158ECN6_9BURK|nr:ompA family protein [Caballeronia calidae]
MSATMSLSSDNTALLPVALRDTALTISDLEGRDEHGSDSIDSLRDECKGQIARLKEELRARRLSSDEIDDAVYAQCALLDEAALRCLEGAARDEWEQKPLQLEAFHTNEAGEELIRRMEQRLRERRPAQSLFAIFAAVLDLGFKGRFALDGDDARMRLKRAIDERLGTSQDANDDGSVVIEAAVRLPWMRRISPLAGIALACAMIGMVWFGIDSWLDASVAHMVQKESR